MSNVKSSDVTEEQLTQIKSYLSKNNLSAQQAYDLLLARGMSQAEATTLRGRLEVIGNSGSSGNTSLPEENSRGGERRVSDTSNKTIQVVNPRKIFGLEIFNNGVLSFEPNISIATPVGYVIGPNDEININIFGYQEAKYNLKVGPEGDINIPYVGVMYVAGLTIEQATARIKSRLSNAGYANIKTGLTKVSVTIGRIRSIKVTILGEAKKPGTYTLPSLATAFNALYLSGGPTEMGSMRNIEIVRNGRVAGILDIYDFLVKADQRANLLLQDQDVIRIPAYKVRVSLEGEVKRTGLFEMKANESLQTLLEFAGGFSDSAYTASITGYKVTDVENRIIDIAQNQFATYKPGRSESFVVKKILGRFINRVTISGAVYLPGDYELTEGMTLKELINKARGLKQDAYNGRGLILRSREDLTPEYLSFSPIEVVREASSNLVLRPNDRVTISSVGQLRENTTVSINGEVRNTGEYPFVENMSLKDLILLAGGFTDAAIPQRIEVARRLKTDSFNISDIKVSEVFNITSLNDLQERGSDIKLQSYDAVIVRKNPAYQPQISVSVEGEVPYPGAYVLKNKNDRISDVIKRAGGLTLQAYEQGGYVTRRNNKTLINELNSQKINTIQETLKDTSRFVEQQVERKFDQIAIDLTTILASPGSKNDLVLEEGDIITIPKEKMDVRISGQVLFPTRVVYQEKLDLKDYLGRAGGVSENARKSKIYVLYPNGNAAKTSHFLFFRSYPKITPGSEVIVPKKHEVERRRLSTGEVIGITTAITSFAGVLISLLINLK
ncbi:SLBB domain-containing protein [Segetibacter aerophilus]|uniref:Capsule polysaccharide transporter n=1 Tax=Segetibacter aerophilus TaxID=670293 RepID=A0A512BI46_9BACT|nr:SLBB domain-containing protein [Segetibacter aerophilus]GEO11621.1 capsule polysaccharide transporter [Segetibacter aerophilus]